MAASLVLLDTSGLFAYVNAAEATHPPALKHMQQQRRMVVHSYVISELVALARARKYPINPILLYLRTLYDHSLIEIVWVDHDIHDRALVLIDQRSDKEYSLADAVSFVIMRDRGITEALTMDRHFQQEGFRALLID
jgi:predicted nucleic acid-binding protein